MALKREVYRAFEDIVGPEHISEDPVILDSYCFCWGMDILFEGSGKFGPRPDVVMLPGSVEEIQAIVMACNRYKVIFKALSTGFSTCAFGVRDGWISLDLRRMDRILEMDEKNMYAVVEPYVSFGKLMDEAHKKGLRSHIMSAGNQASVVADFTNMGGGGASTAMSTGTCGPEILGVEWVLPDGELVRLGSAESGAGWFNGVGPGPGLRGILRGKRGPNGAMGVVTKMGVRLTPWYGPPVVEVEGANPNYVPVIPDCLRLYDVTFPTRQNMIDAMHMLGEQGIAYGAYRRGPYSLLACMTGSNQECWEYYSNDEYLARLENLMQVSIDASSPREQEFKEKVLYHIVDKFDGAIPPELNENDRYDQRRRFLYAYNCVGGYKAVFRAGTAFCEMSCNETLDSHQKAVDIWLDIKKEYLEKGLVLQDADSSCHQSYPDGRGGGGSQAVRYDQTNPESVRALDELRTRAIRAYVDNYLGGGLHPDEREARAAAFNCRRLIEKVKTSFDPNLVGEYCSYPTPGVEPMNMVE